jgi:hypothetical protein
VFYRYITINDFLIQYFYSFQLDKQIIIYRVFVRSHETELECYSFFKHHAACIGVEISTDEVDKDLIYISTYYLK